MAAAAEEKGTTMDVRPYQSRDEAPVLALWEESGLTRPWNDPHEDIRRKPWRSWQRAAFRRLP
jgi:hypothetical protein